MNYSPLAGVHFAKYKRPAATTNTIRRQLSHRPQLGFSRSAKSFNVADEVLAISQVSSKSLIGQVLHRLEEFSSLCLQ
jgi:hypothetical protein